MDEYKIYSVNFNTSKLKGEKITGLYQNNNKSVIFSSSDYCDCIDCYCPDTPTPSGGDCYCDCHCTPTE